ncbi:MAG: acetyltransferase, partial [Saccharofermentanales bacterium]
VALSMKKWDKISFMDDDTVKKTEIGLEVIGNTEHLSNYITEYDIFVAIGNNAIREKITDRIKNLDGTIPVLIHSNAVLGSSVDIDFGTVVMPGAVINCCTKIGKGCIINTGSTIDHDNQLGDYVHISPGANLAGTVKIGKGTWIGAGAVVINNIEIIDGCIIGAGAVVVKNITESGTYVGIPVRKIVR